MVAKPQNPPTRADLDALPANMKGEIIEGVLYAMTKARSPHQVVSTRLSADLMNPFERGRGGPGGWWIISEPGIELANTPEIVPDIAGWRKERMLELPRDTSILTVPDWVCEILSPTTRRHNLLIKMPYYAKVGVKHLWMVDLDARALMVYRLGRDWERVASYGDETEARIEPFDAVPLDVSSWWA